MCTPFGAATLLPAAGYARTVVLYLVERTFLSDDGTFELGMWEIPN